MAKALPVPGLDPGQSFGLAAARVIEVRSRELIDAMTVLGEGPTTTPREIHRVRVSARRLRTTLEIFRPCLPGRRSKAALLEVSTVADSLSARRDVDVALEALFLYQANVESLHGSGVDLLITDLLAERDQARSEAVEFEADEIEGLNELLASLFEHARKRAHDAEADEAEGPMDAADPGGGDQ